MKTIFLDAIPTDSAGRYSRLALLDLLGPEVATWHREGRFFVTVFSGASPGNSPLYMDLATQLGRGIEKRGGVLVNGSVTAGTMGAVQKPCSRVLGLTTQPFHQRGGEGQQGQGAKNEIKIVTPDFDLRKVVMTVLSSGPFIALPGGYGTLDEWGEIAMYALDSAAEGSPDSLRMAIYCLGPKGFWDGGVEAQWDHFSSYGLVNPRRRNAIRFMHDPEDVLDDSLVFLARKRARMRQARPLIRGPKAAQSAPNFIRAHAEQFVQTLFDFIGSDGNPLDETDAPRLGVIASRHIASGGNFFNLKSPALRRHFIARATELGRRLGNAKTVAVLSGDRQGLRALIADAATACGGKIIWLEVDEKQTEPLVAIRSDKRPAEMALRVSRHHEKEWLFDFLCQSQIVLAGGEHTLKEMHAHITRNQTEHNLYCNLIDGCAHPDYWPERLAQRPERRVIHLFDPPDGQGTSLWGPIRAHYLHAANEGFISLSPARDDLALLCVHDRMADLVTAAIAETRTTPDLFLAFAMQTYEQASRPSCGGTPIGKSPGLTPAAP